ncbi:transposase [Desulfovibrio inopinatus]|uniref:transposase n=1 Tax=Desulfovibrio inopinatus TaxID=102109 RepID=UPI000683F6C1|nr:transposase [Desulfovibrio inopinatus]
MPRIPRLLLEDRPSVYHVMSRTALDGYPFDDACKEMLLTFIRQFSAIYFCEILGFAIMGNHFHLLVRMTPSNAVTDSDILMRFHQRYGQDALCPPVQLEKLRSKWTSLSELMRELKQSFSRYYNKRYGRRGTLWGERFKSVLVENGRTLINCLAYIDLNPVRAGLVRRPEDYRWCSLGHHVQSGNRDDLLSLDFGLVEWDIESTRERLRLYRQFLYETGALTSSQGKPLSSEIVATARQQNYEYTLAQRFLWRTRWFSEAGILGSKSFVSSIAQHLGLPGAEKRSPKRISGLDTYSLKRLSELTP